MLYTIRDHMKQILIALAAVAVVAAGIYAGLSLSRAEAEGKPIEELEVTVKSEAAGWNADKSTPAIARVKGETQEAETVDYYHAFPASGDETIKLKPGAYEMSFISPVNEDGYYYRAPNPVKFDTKSSDEGKVSVTAVYTGVAPAQAKDEDANKIIAEVTEAAAFGDGTLSGDAGSKVAQSAKLYLAGAAATSSRQPSGGEGGLNWAGSSSSSAVNVRAAEESSSSSSSSSTEPSSSSSSSSASTQSPTSSASSSSSTAAATNPEAPAVRKWVAAVYTEKAKHKAEWVDDGNGAGHYEIVDAGTERHIEKAGHYE